MDHPPKHLFDYNTSGKNFDGHIPHDREFLENAYSHYASNNPAEARKLHKRFWNARHCAGAYFELYLYGLLTREGAQITIEPDFGQGKCPDFLVEFEGEQFVLEAKVILSSPSKQEFGYNGNEEDVIKIIKSMGHDKFTFEVNYSGKLRQNLTQQDIETKLRPVLDWCEAHFDDLTWGIQDGWGISPTREWDIIRGYHEGTVHPCTSKYLPQPTNIAFIEVGDSDKPEWKMSICVAPRRSAKCGVFFPEPQRILNTLGDTTGRRDMDEEVVKKLHKYTKGYKDFPVPSVIAVNLKFDQLVEFEKWIPPLMTGENPHDLSSGKRDGWLNKRINRDIDFAAFWFCSFYTHSPSLPQHQIFKHPGKPGEGFPELLNRFDEKLSAGD